MVDRAVVALSAACSDIGGVRRSEQRPGFRQAPEIEQNPVEPRLDPGRRLDILSLLVELQRRPASDRSFVQAA
jgi:hypothetical protein